MKNWKVVILVIIGLALLAKLVSFFLKEDIDKTLDESGFDYNEILSNYDTLPSEFTMNLAESPFLSKEELHVVGFNLIFLVPKDWLPAVPPAPEIYRKHSRNPEVSGVFSIVSQEIKNTFLDEADYVNAWKAQLDAIGSNSEILNSKYLNSKSMEVLLIESLVVINDNKRTAMIHCHYALKDISFSINFYSNFNYYMSHKNDIDQCVKSLRIIPM